MFLETISPINKNSLVNKLVERTDTNLQEIFKKVLEKYGKIKSIEIEANNDRLYNPWEPNKTIKTLFVKINDAKEYSFFPNHLW